jgi:hypothetical protein
LISLKEEVEDNELVESDTEMNTIGTQGENSDDSDVTTATNPENGRPKLGQDPILRETLAITADYAQLLDGQQPGTIRFPELDTLVVADASVSAASDPVNSD